MRHHLVRGGEIVATRDFREDEAVPELAPSKGVWLPEVVNGEEYDPATQVQEGPTQTIGRRAVTVAYTVRAKTPEEIAGMRAAKMAQIKAEARRRILRRFPEWKQANMTARGVELTNIRHSRAWTAEERAESDALANAWTGIKAVRTRSDELEASIPDNAAGIAAFDPAAGWD